MRPAVRHSWAQMYSGAAVNILVPHRRSFRLTDIAVSLASLARFNGHTKFLWTVGSHSLLAERLLPPHTDPLTRLHVLLHDAHEAVTGDIITPMKDVIATVAGTDIIAFIADGVQREILEAANLPGDAAYRDVIRSVDLLALAMERRDLMSESERPWGDDLPEVSEAAVPLEPSYRGAVRDAFIARAIDLGTECGAIPSFGRLPFWTV